MPSVHWNCPYADIYAKIFDRIGVQYDMISFNRKMDSEDTKYHFDYALHNSSKHYKKFWAIHKYCSFVGKVLKKEKYDRLVVFGSQLGLGLLLTLINNYKGKYIIDYRDVSIEQRFKYLFKLLLKNSYINVISSPGFKDVLPIGFQYEVCHNINIEKAEDAVKKNISGGWHSGRKRILTIGSIRDYWANKEVIDAIKDIDGYELCFVGRGESSVLLENYCKQVNASNVSFVGFYKKDEEESYILKSDYINIYYPRKQSHNTAISNRFYNSLIYKKPMITTSNTTQGNYAISEKVGVALDTCDNLIEQLELFVRENDFVQYCYRCNSLLKQFIIEQKSFENRIVDFVR